MVIVPDGILVITFRSLLHKRFWSLRKESKGFFSFLFLFLKISKRKNEAAVQQGERAVVYYVVRWRGIKFHLRLVMLENVVL